MEITAFGGFNLKNIHTPIITRRQIMREKQKYSQIFGEVLKRNRLLGLLLASGFLAVFYLWPFEFRGPPKYSVENGALISREADLRFEQAGIAYDENASADLFEMLAGGKTISIAVSAKSYTDDQFGPARIVSFSRDLHAANFVLGQHGRDIVFRLRTPGTGLDGIVDGLVARDVVRPGELQTFVATYDGQTFRIFVDGVLADSTARSAGPLADWDPGFQLYFGNEGTGNRPWLGTIKDVLITSSVLKDDDVTKTLANSSFDTFAQSTYLLRRQCFDIASGATERSFDAADFTCEAPAQLQISEPFDIFTLKNRTVIDIFQNFFVWIAFSSVFYLAEVAKNRRFGLYILLVSAVILEASQAAVVNHSSSLIDLTCAILGVVIGYYLQLVRKPTL